MNSYWQHKAEKEIRDAFPDADLMFESLDTHSTMGVTARVNNFRRAIRLGPDDAWVAKAKALIEETTAKAPVT